MKTQPLIFGLTLSLLSLALIATSQTLFHPSGGAHSGMEIMRIGGK